MAKQGSDGGQKKAFSSRLMQMKFMKRGQDNAAKETTAAAAATAAPPQQEAATSSAAEWVAEERAAPAGCMVISEADPPPGAATGHMAFGGFKPDADKAQAEAGSRAKGGRQAEEAEGDVSDADLARRLGREDMTAKSMRMQKKARHK